MAAPWVPIRVDLARDPKVIRMADYLLRDPEFIAWLAPAIPSAGGKIIAAPNFLEWKNGDEQPATVGRYGSVTRYVTRALCVTGLVTVWGNARENGNRENHDLVVDHCDIESLEAIAEIPNFGRAMAFVEWVEQYGVDAVCFPKFFQEKESPSNRFRSTNAERQARYRERQRSRIVPEGGVTRNVTGALRVTSRVTGEERRGEESKDTSPNLKISKGERPRGRALANGDELGNANHPSNQSPKNSKAKKERPRKLTPEEWEEAVTIAERLAKFIPPQSDEDRRAWFRYAALAVRTFGEDWIADAIEAVRHAKERKGKRQAHLVGVLQSKAVTPGGLTVEQFNELAGSIDIPRVVWQSPAVQVHTSRKD